MSNTVQTLIDENPMSSTQIIVVVLCTLLNMMDGIDILITAFTASSIMSEWNLSNQTLGLLLSSGLFGMAAGALFLAPLADKIGRRTLIIISLIIISPAMVLSAYSSNYIELSFLRFITGIGVGGMIASINTITAEYSSLKRRNFAVTIVQSGNPVGGVLGGLAAVYIISQFGWRSAFLYAGLISCSLIPLIYWKLPESLTFLIKAQPKNAIKKINSILSRMNYERIDVLPAKEQKPENKSISIKKLFSNENRKNTILLWLSFFTIMFSFYFTMSWTPKLLILAGMSTSEGISGSILLNLGGIIGAPLLGYFATKYKLQKLIGLYGITTAALMIAFGFLTNNFMPALFVAIFLGFFLFGTIIGLYALAPHVYGVDLRATGLGYAIGVGRLGAVLAPLLAGHLLDIELSIPVLFLIFSAPLFLCGYAQNKIYPAGFK